MSVTSRKPALAGIALLVLWGAQCALAQRAPPAEAAALVHVYSAFMTQSDPGVMAKSVVLGPELQRAFALPPKADGARVYDALIALTGQKQMDVRQSAPQELAQYGARRGFNRNGGPLYTMEAGNLRFLLQYDLQHTTISFVGQLGLPDPDARPTR